jgi:multisubunit Na+/H+ antiporter MnhG subunit
MTFTPRAQRVTIAVYMCLVAALWAYAWWLPAVSLDSEAAGFLVTARSLATGNGYVIGNLPHPVPQTNFPPLFPGLLALFTLVSQQAQWLKLLPLLCGLGWMLLTHRLLLRMGASANSALLLIGLTAASPTVIFLSTSLVPETLFALLATAALLALLDEHPFLAGGIAGLATLTRTGGIGLIVACIVTLAVRRRFRGAVVFTAIAMLITAPWFGWTLAHFSRGVSHESLEIFTSLAANEKLVVVFQNFGSLLASPFSLLAGFGNVYFIVGTLFLLGRALWIRRQLVPDLFVVLFSLSLLVWTVPPERYVAPVMPLFFWMIWRAFRLMRNREALAAIVLIILATPLVADATRLLPAHASGVFPRERIPADDWQPVSELSDYMRANTAPDAVLLANLDGAFFLSTGRQTVRGFVPSHFDLYYLQRPSISPDELSRAILREGVGWVIVTPDRGLAESSSFHVSVQALERGNVMEPVAVPGLRRDYQLFKVIAH